MAVDLYNFKNLGCDILGLLGSTPTPSSLDFEPTSGLAEIDHHLIECARAWGRPFGYWQEQGGSVVQNIFPIRKTENDQISSSSKTELEMHTETAFHPWLPQYVFLLCLRGDENAGTTFVDLDDLLVHLSTQEIQLLHEPVFETSIDSSFLSVQQQNANIKMPVLFNNGSSIRYDRNLMTSTDPEAQQVLKRIAEIVDVLKVTIVLRAGDLAVIHNWRTIHGRTPFSPRYDGTDRWLKRVLVRRSMPPARDIDMNEEADIYVVNTILS